jgi:hypothetical protein
MANGLFVPVNKVPELKVLKGRLRKELSGLGFVTQRITVGVTLVDSDCLLDKMIYIMDHEVGTCCWLTFMSADDSLLEVGENGVPFIAHVSGGAGGGRRLALAVSYDVSVEGQGGCVYDDGHLYLGGGAGYSSIEGLKKLLVALK